MKSLIMKFVPGVVFSMAVFVFGGFLLAQSSATSTNAGSGVPAVVSPAPLVLPAPQVPQVQYLPAPAPVQYIICGACGAQIQAAQPVLVAAPVYRPAYYPNPYGYPEGDPCVERIPLRSVFSLSNYPAPVNPRRIPHVYEPRYRN